MTAYNNIVIASKNGLLEEKYVIFIDTQFCSMQIIWNLLLAIEAVLY